MTRRTLLFGARMPTVAGGERGGWVLLDGERVVATGSSGQTPPPADRRLELDGATLLPAFCDAHVHLLTAGLYESALDVRHERSARGLLKALEQRASSGDAVLLAGNLEDPLDEPLTRSDLDAATANKPALLARADLRSCIVSSGLLASLALDGLQGVDRDEDGRPTGYLREQAASAAWDALERSISPRQVGAAVRAAARRAYSRGIAEVHEMFALARRGRAALEDFQEIVAPLALAVEIYPASDDVGDVKDMGFRRVGGDFFLDGSFGSYTAWTSSPYASKVPSGSGPTGIRFVSDEDLYRFFSAASRAGLQTGVHAIGDAAIEQAISTWERVAAKIGLEVVRAGGHRLEHFECSSDEHLARAARLRLGASVQPAFDRFWGGEHGLYAERIGWERASKMNRFRSMLRAGLLVGAGSDAPVTPLDPFLQMASLRRHHLEEESVGARAALDLHTRGSYALAGSPVSKGAVEAGFAANLALVDRNPLECDPDELLATRVLATWVGGKQVWPEEDAEAE